MSKHTNPAQIQTATQFVRQFAVFSVRVHAGGEVLDLVEHELCIVSTQRHCEVGRVVQIMPTEYNSPIREHHLGGFVGMADSDHDIAVTDKVFYQCSSLLSVKPI